MFEERDGLDHREEPRGELDRLAKAVIRAAIEAHRLLGPGHMESAYEEALCIELGLRQTPLWRQIEVALQYKGYPVGRSFIDILVDGQLVPELKACEALAPIYRAQVISYLRITGYRLGILMNFNVPVLKDGIKRMIHS